MKIIWLTDIHLNAISHDERTKFYHKITQSYGTAVLISGDIAETPTLEDILQEMAMHIKKPIYFVLGNHDYYEGRVAKVRAAMTVLSKKNKNLFWLPATGPQRLENESILIGQDGWADGRLGNYWNSRVSRKDSHLIAELSQANILSKVHLLHMMRQLADADAKQLQQDLLKAIALNPATILVLTHFPPFKEACIHKGRLSDDDFLPFFCCKAIGDVLIKIAKGHPTIKFLVFSGHTHNEANYQALENLMIHVGKAVYYYPEIREVIL